MPRRTAPRSPAAFPDAGADDAFFEGLFAEAEREAGRGAGAAFSKPAPKSVQKPAPAPARKAAAQSFTAAPAPSRSSSSLRRPGFMPPPPAGDGARTYPADGRTPAFRGTAALLEPAPRRAPWDAQERRGEPDEGDGQGARALERAALRREKPLTVSETLERLRDALTGVVDGLWLAGEVAQVKPSAQGHLYFSLKDERGFIECVQFGGARGAGRLFALGERIEVRGRADIYPARGRLQFVADSWRPAGQGGLYEAFLALKAKLEAEGLFRAERKKPLPVFVRRVAVVTSAAAAAWSDVERTLRRRTPWVECILFESPVQGPDAPAALVRALRCADRAGCDVVLLVRGGGAYEDLQAYNDETLARTLAAMRTPVVTGVGHESDVTIADLTADLRASTPTAAAESIGPDLVHWLKRLEKSREALERASRRQMEDLARRLDTAADHLPDPLARIEALAARLALLGDNFTPAEQFLAPRIERVHRAARFMGDPEQVLSSQKKRLETLFTRLEGLSLEGLERRERMLAGPAQRLPAAVARVLADAARSLELAALRRPDPAVKTDLLEARLNSAASAFALSDPDRPLRAGYVRVRRRDGLATSAAMLSAGDQVELVFADGTAAADVRAVNLRPAAPGETVRLSKE
ncbi:exodeoxyribonuclease VII large subunit [Sutterella sp.]|uniref:exodeoxyribonuclease VII large subunit n=1 Tax=Sutterella sp. TaxID=1981025 RepID=UPI003FD8E14A